MLQERLLGTLEHQAQRFGLSAGLEAVEGSGTVV